MLVGVPYAARAASADTLAGRTADSFVLSENLAQLLKKGGFTPTKDPKNPGDSGDIGILSFTAPNTSTPNAVAKWLDNAGTLGEAVGLFESTGKIGIGTTNPAYRLHVNETDATAIRVGGDGAAGVTGIVRANDSNSAFTDDADWNGTAWVARSTEATMLVMQNGIFSLRSDSGLTAGTTFTPTTRLHIDASGNVGVGTTTPGAKWAVNGGAALGRMKITGAGAGYTQADIVLQTGTSDGPEARGLGIYAFNEGTDANWYFGNPYSSPDRFVVNRKAGGAFSSAAAETTNSLLTILASGNVGVGTTSPAAKLEVIGDAAVSGNSTVSGTTTTGTVRIGGASGIAVTRDAGFVVVDGGLRATGVLEAKYQDVAEWVDTPAALAAGTVVIVDPDRTNNVIPAAQAYDTRVAGAVSRQPGLVLGEATPNGSLVAQSGRVRIKVDATYGAIRIGDLLVTSPTPGHAMLSKAVKVAGITMHRPATVLGKALEAWSSGMGEILVLLTLQ